MVFDNKLIEDAKTIDRRDQILEIAERAERDAILFVSELQKMYPIMAKEEMAIILNEEKKHLKMVLEKQELQQPYIRGL